MTQSSQTLSQTIYENMENETLERETPPLLRETQDPVGGGIMEGGNATREATAASSADPMLRLRGVLGTSERAMQVYQRAYEESLSRHPGPGVLVEALTQEAQEGTLGQDEALTQDEAEEKTLGPSFDPPLAQSDSPQPNLSQPNSSRVPERSAAEEPPLARPRLESDTRPPTLMLQKEGWRCVLIKSNLYNLEGTSWFWGGPESPRTRDMRTLISPRCKLYGCEVVRAPVVAREAMAPFEIGAEPEEEESLAPSPKK